MRRHLCGAIASSLKAIVRALVREPAPLVTRCLRRTVAHADSIGLTVRR